MNRKASAPGILRQIVDRKRAEVAGLERAAAAWRAAAEAAAPAPSFEAALRAGGTVAVIGEVKRRSPSAGALGADLAARAAAYAAGGAAAISVLTDEPFFGGSLADLEEVRGAVPVPLLRKDFTIAPVQLWQAKAAGASAVLLIVRLLAPGELVALQQLAAELGLAALVEVHGAAELELALGAGARIVGVNNRDLDSLEVDLATTLRLAELVPGGRLLVSESGIRDAADVAALAAAGVAAVLVGEALLRSPDPAALVAALAALPRRVRP